MMKEEALAKQEQIVASGYKLEWWYGTNCEKCCGVYPRLETEGNIACEDVFYVCEVCGKRTKGYVMPWLARDAWNRHEYKSDYTQMKLF